MADVVVVRETVLGGRWSVPRPRVKCWLTALAWLDSGQDRQASFSTPGNDTVR